MIAIILVIISMIYSALAEDETNSMKASPEGNLNNISLTK